MGSEMGQRGRKWPGVVGTVQCFHFFFFLHCFSLWCFIPRVPEEILWVLICPYLCVSVPRDEMKRWNLVLREFANQCRASFFNLLLWLPGSWRAGLLPDGMHFFISCVSFNLLQTRTWVMLYGNLWKGAYRLCLRWPGNNEHTKPTIWIESLSECETHER